MKEQEFDHIIKQKLEAVSNEPPAYMWSKIASAIPPPAATAVATTGMTGTAKVILLAASAVIIGGLTFLLSQNNNDVKRPALKNTQYTIEKVNLRHHNNTAIKIDSEYSGTVLIQTNDNIQALEATAINTNTTNQNSISSNRKAVDNSNQEFDSAFENASKSPGVKSKLKTTEPQKEKSVKSKIKKQPVSLKLAVVPQISNEQEPTSSNSALQTETSKKENQSTPVVEPTKSLTEEVAVVETPQEEVVAEVNEPDVIEDDSQVTEKLNKPEPAVAKENPKNRQLNKYGIGIHYGPEFMDVGGIKLTDHAVDFSFNYQNMNFILQTGLGLRYSQEKVDYNLKYKRWDFIETQVRFDSAIFVLDQNGNPVLQPVDPYYEDVYDSVRHRYSAQATEQSYMLQIPLTIGYQKDFKKFAYFVKGGIRYSLVVYTNTTNLFEIDDASHLDYLSYPSKGRAVSNIDYEMSIGGIYKMTKKFQVHAELFGRYYQYSIYSENPPSGIHPWSLSGRIGLVYLLN